MKKQKPNNSTDWREEFDKWFNHGTKLKPRFILSSDFYNEVKDFISSELQREKQDILNNLHALVCDLSNKNQNPELKKEDCLEIIRYQIERINGKKLEKVKL